MRGRARPQDGTVGRPSARSAVLSAAILVLLLGLGSGSSPEAAARTAQPAVGSVSRVVLRATTTAEWSTLELSGVDLLDAVVRSGGAAVNSDKPIVYGPAGATGSGRGFTVELLVVVPPAGDVELEVTEAGGAAQTAVNLEVVSQGGTRTPVARAVTDPGEGGAASATVDRARLLAQPLDLGPRDPERLAILMVHPWWNGEEIDRFGPARPQGAWRFSDPNEVAAQVRAMGDMGVDVLAFSFGFPDDLEGDPMIDSLVAAVVADGRMRLMPLIELDASNQIPAEIDRQVSSAWRLVRQNPDRFVWRVNHRGVRAPVMFFYGDHLLPSGTWNEALTRAADRGEPVFALGQSRARDRLIDSYYLYNVANVATGSLPRASRDQWFAARVASILRPAEPAPAALVATVSPGYDDRSIRGASSMVQERRGLERYRATWAAALQVQPDWVFISTWNEWWEQTHIAPDTVAGTAAYEETRRWITQLHGGRPPMPCQDRCSAGASSSLGSQRTEGVPSSSGPVVEGSDGELSAPASPPGQPAAPAAGGSNGTPGLATTRSQDLEETGGEREAVPAPVAAVVAVVALVLTSRALAPSLLRRPRQR